jgi:hypothetical protein
MRARFCAQAIEAVMRKPAAELFRVPVPRSIPRYYQVITNPQDLGTIAERLRHGKYASLQVVAADIAQVWANCRTFNHAQSPVAAAGRQCEALMQREWRKLGLPL